VVIARGCAILQRAMTIGQARGKPVERETGATVFVTIHPSYLLRQAHYRAFVADQKHAGRATA
jgi:uracil-DNA glycosylase